MRIKAMLQHGGAGSGRHGLAGRMNFGVLRPNAFAAHLERGVEGETLACGTGLTAARFQRASTHPRP